MKYKLQKVTNLFKGLILLKVVIVIISLNQADKYKILMIRMQLFNKMKMIVMSTVMLLKLFFLVTMIKINNNLF